MYNLKLFLCCFLFFIFSNNTSGQTFKAGIITGINFSKLTGDDLKGFNQFGLNIGGRVAVDFTKYIRVATDVLFTQKGSKRSVDQTSGNQFENIRLNYMQIPITLNIMDWMDDPDEEPYHRLHFTFGAAYSRLIHFKVIDKDGIDISDTQNFKKNTADLITGLTYFVNKNIGVSLQYSKSVNPIQKSDINPPMKSKNIMLRMFYML